MFAELAEQHGAALIDEWAGRGISALSYLDAGYPPGLAALSDPPPLLFTRGELVAADQGGVAVIGTRQPGEAGRRLAAEIARVLVDAGRTVISGLALGIDAAAHSAALDAGGRTVAVLGNGVERIYPAANAALQSRINVLVSQFWPEQPPARTNFPQRNAVMASISRATVIVEAGERSGARIQARHALAQGRALFLMAPVMGEGWAQTLAQQAGVSVLDAPADLPDALS